MKFPLFYMCKGMCKGGVCDIIHFMTRTCNQAYQYNSHLSRHFVNSTGQRTLLFLNTSSCIYPTFAQIPFDFYSAFSAPLIVCGVCPVSTGILLAFSLPAVFTLWYNKRMKLQHDKKKFTEQLLDWYDQNARVLPWREDASPYRVWVSEIMLQQTRVEAVKPYFERFIQALPSLKALAEADEDTLRKLWEGLGYYNRVRNMKKCAMECMERHNGVLPDTNEELLKLPGIGAYTAGAIASIAYKRCVPAVDGNVLRVFSRVLVSEDDILKERTKKKFQDIIQEYIPEHRSDAFNQALMEIGALVCVPNAAPRCNICPLASECMGYQSGAAHRLPNKTAKKDRRIEKKTVLVLLCKDRVYLHKRDEQGLLAGLYEFMMLDEQKSRKEITQEFQDQLLRLVPLRKAKHIFSHVEWHMNGYLLELKQEAVEGVWCTKDELQKTYAIPTALKVYREALLTWIGGDS